MHKRILLRMQARRALSFSHSPPSHRDMRFWLHTGAPEAPLRSQCPRVSTSRARRGRHLLLQRHGSRQWNARACAVEVTSGHPLMPGVRPHPPPGTPRAPDQGPRVAPTILRRAVAARGGASASGAGRKRTTTTVTIRMRTHRGLRKQGRAIVDSTCLHLLRIRAQGRDPNRTHSTRSGRRMRLWLE